MVVYGDLWDFYGYLWDFYMDLVGLTTVELMKLMGFIGFMGFSMVELIL